jgi:hypothetical protein
MNLKIETTTELNVLQVAVDDIVEHLQDLPAHDDLEVADFADRLTAAKALKARLDTVGLP